MKNRDFLKINEVPLISSLAATLQSSVVVLLEFGNLQNLGLMFRYLFLGMLRISQILP